MRNFIRFLKSKSFRVNFAIAFVSITLLLFLVLKWLGVYTKHGETISVPDLKGIDIVEAMDRLDEQGFKYVIDSIYTDQAETNTVYEQEPEANSLVKENRTIYLTVVSGSAPNVKLPDLIDVSLREAQAILESYGIKVGKLIYRPDLAQNAVLGIQYQGRDVQKGYSIAKGEVVDLILGDGYGNLKVSIPNLVGLSYDEALFVLQGSKLILGAVIFDGFKNDTLNATVYRQSPEPSTDTSANKISQGETIDIYLKVK
ncbi:MAG: PASTA domain-containing protein [Sphingobacteriales bacterium]|jgi:beta-lactam-binding protein with PASTA domain|nr:PASTA domain-containing protein [Sphingobacteriales bacterium]